MSRMPLRTPPLPVGGGVVVPGGAVVVVLLDDEPGGVVPGPEDGGGVVVELPSSDHEGGGPLDDGGVAGVLPAGVPRSPLRLSPPLDPSVVPVVTVVPSAAAGGSVVDRSAPW
jgi:hypothetical protein